jgi:hypothetical protein
VARHLSKSISSVDTFWLIFDLCRPPTFCVYLLQTHTCAQRMAFYTLLLIPGGSALWVHGVRPHERSLGPLFASLIWSRPTEELKLTRHLYLDNVKMDPVPGRTTTPWYHFVDGCMSLDTSCTNIVNFYPLGLPEPPLVHCEQDKLRHGLWHPFLFSSFYNFLVWNFVLRYLFSFV